MKIASVKATKVKKVKSDPSKQVKSFAFIGARRSGSKVTISLENTRRSSAGKFAIIRSTRSLPKMTSAGQLNSGQGWLENPDLGNRLNMVFAKAVKAAKKQSAKLIK